MNFRYFAENALQLYGAGNIDWKVEQRYERDAVVVYGRDRATGRFASYEVSGLEQYKAESAQQKLALLQHCVDTIEELLGKGYDEMGNNQGSAGNQRATTTREAKEGLYASQNGAVREKRRTLLELLDE